MMQHICVVVILATLILAVIWSPMWGIFKMIVHMEHERVQRLIDSTLPDRSGEHELTASMLEIPLVDNPNELGIIYISGPMSSVGPPTWNFPAFEAKAQELREQGYVVISPHEYDEVDGQEWDWYLRRDILQLVKCGRIVMLEGWEVSKGARLEKLIAEELGMEVTLP